jgi:acyl transferase domain-containing protein
LSPDGKCYSFDSRASGYGRGEGVAAVVLKPLNDAIRDGDPIRAVIAQTALNQDGKTQTITSPSQAAQEQLMRLCYEQANLDPGETAYVEAHGTGTKAGDPVEAGAIHEVFCKDRDRPQPLYLGSVKSNIGHLETASGFAAIIKVALALEKGLIPPSINFEEPNVNIPLAQWDLKVRMKFFPGSTCTSSYNCSCTGRFLENYNHGQRIMHGVLQSTTLDMVALTLMSF